MVITAAESFCLCLKKRESNTRPRSKGGVGGECQWHEPTLRRRDTSRREARQGRRGRVESALLLVLWDESPDNEKRERKNISKR